MSSCLFGPKELPLPGALRAEDLAREARSVYNILQYVMLVYGWREILECDEWRLTRRIRRVDGTELCEDERMTCEVVRHAADEEERGNRGPLDYVHQHLCRWGQERVVLLVRDAWALVPPLYRLANLMAHGRQL